MPIISVQKYPNHCAHTANRSAFISLHRRRIVCSGGAADCVPLMISTSGLVVFNRKQHSGTDPPTSPLPVVCRRRCSALDTFVHRKQTESEWERASGARESRESRLSDWPEKSAKSEFLEWVALASGLEIGHFGRLAYRNSETQLLYL